MKLPQPQPTVFSHQRLINSPHRQNSTSFSSYLRLACGLLTAALGLFTGLATQGHAASTVPGTYSTTIGSISVIAIEDRKNTMDISIFSGPATPAERSALVPSGKAPAGYNAFIVKSEGKTILIDAGLGTAAPGESLLLPRLGALGISPESVDTVLLTHMHRDHIGGLLKGNSPAFPNATILVAAPEAAYWLSPENIKQAEADKNPTSLLAMSVSKAYGKAFTTFTDSLNIPGIAPIPAYGHTPGHTAYLIESQGKRLYIIGDLIHAAALQFPKPEECAKFDMNPAEAVASRKALLTRAANEKAPIAGMHLPFPPAGTVITTPTGFTFTPYAAQ